MTSLQCYLSNFRQSNLVLEHLVKQHHYYVGLQCRTYIVFYCIAYVTPLECTLIRGAKHMAAQFWQQFLDWNSRVILLRRQLKMLKLQCGNRKNFLWGGAHSLPIPGPFSALHMLRRSSAGCSFVPLQTNLHSHTRGEHALDYIILQTYRKTGPEKGGRRWIAPGCLGGIEAPGL